MADAINPPPSDRMPPQPKTTTELPAVPPWAIELTKSVKEGFARVDDRLDDQGASLEAVVNEGKRTNTRLTRLEERVDELEPRIGRSSTRVREESSVNLKQDAAIAQVSTDVAALKEAIGSSTEFRKMLVDTTKEALGNPMTKRVGQALAAAAIAGLTYLTAYLQMRGGH